LVSSDRAIIALRKKLLSRCKELMNGTEPPETAKPHAYGVRAVDFFLPRDVPMHEGARDLLVCR
jgi:hypothetical protein